MGCACVSLLAEGDTFATRRAEDQLPEAGLVGPADRGRRGDQGGADDHPLRLPRHRRGRLPRRLRHLDVHDPARRSRAGSLTVRDVFLGLTPEHVRTCQVPGTVPGTWPEATGRSPGVRIATWICATPPTRLPSARRCATSSRRTCRTARRRAAPAASRTPTASGAEKLGEAGLRRPDLAEGVRRRGRAVQPPGDLPRGARARRGAVAPRRDRPRHGRPDDHRLGHRGAEAALPLEDPQRRGDLVPGLLGAGRRQRPRRGAHADRGPGRPLPRQRPEGLVVVRAHRRLLHPRRPGRPRRAEVQEPDVRDRRHARARRRGAAARADHRPPRVQRDLLHRRQGAEGEHPRRRSATAGRSR